MEKEKIKKNMPFMVLASVGIVVLILIVPTFFNKSINIFDMVTVTFKGFDGKGNVYVDTSKVEHEDEKIELFLKTIKYVPDKKGTLRNDESVKIFLDYDEKEADKLGIVFSPESKEYEVNGLEEKNNNKLWEQSPDQINDKPNGNTNKLWENADVSIPPKP